MCRVHDAPQALGCLIALRIPLLVLYQGAGCVDYAILLHGRGYALIERTQGAAVPSALSKVSSAVHRIVCRSWASTT
jgi:hypothetical protein